MKLVVGLGNPGIPYEGTRHNVGFLGADRLAQILRSHAVPLQDTWQENKTGTLLYQWFTVGNSQVELVKPQTQMNRSGVAVQDVLSKHPGLHWDDVYVIHDDLDIPLGKYKIQLGRGPRRHGGLTSIYQSLGTKEFWHVRIGIENRSLQAQSLLRQSSGRAKLKAQSRIVSGEEYVLQRFAESEREVIDRLLDNVTAELLGKLETDISSIS